MTSIETYQERIDAIKASIERLKGDGAFVIQNLPGRAPLIVREEGDLCLPFGTVIAGNEDHVYLRAPHGRIYWESSSRSSAEPRGYNLERFYEFLSRRTMMGERFGIVYQPTG
jgi:hypothetical protein